VAAGDVQQDEKIKTAGRMPAFLKYNFLYVDLTGYAETAEHSNGEV
jgi:hypothetical protein